MWSLFEIVSLRVVQRHNSSNGLCRDALPCEWGWSAIVGQSPARVNFSLRLLFRHTWTLSPAPNLCPCSVEPPLPPPWKRTSELDPWSREHLLLRRELPGGSRVFQVNVTSRGSRASFLGLRGYLMLHRVIFGPRRSFIVLPSGYKYIVLRGVTASACDHGYWPI